jgi:predicted nucleic acid-binding protein
MRVERAPELIVAEVRGRYAARPPLVVDCSVMAADELVSVAVKKSRHGLDDVARQALVDFAELELTRCRPDVHAQWRLALKYDLSGCDAAYLWLAAELGAPLATFDERLGGAARQLLGSP